MGNSLGGFGTSTRDTQQENTTEKTNEANKPPPAPKPIVVQPKFQTPQTAQNPFDTATQQAARYSTLPQNF